MREQLIADGLPLLLDAADAILPLARNASAHEDYSWDEKSGCLHVGDSTVAVSDLERAAAHAYSFMAGAECAWRCMRTASPAFAKLLDAEDPQGGLSAVNKRAAIAHFGTNGLMVARWKLDVGILTVIIDELPLQRINPCFQAVMWASRHLANVDRIVVGVADQRVPVMDLSRPVLDATFFVWKEAVARFSEMPTSTFLPVNAWARLNIELPEQAGRSVAWLALNDAVHAYNQAHESPGPRDERATLLVARLELIGIALAVTMTTLTEQSVAPIRQALDLVIPAGSSALAARHGHDALAASFFESQIRELHESWPVPSLLPTLDPRPLNHLEA